MDSDGREQGALALTGQEETLKTVSALSSITTWQVVTDSWCKPLGPHLTVPQGPGPWRVWPDLCSRVAPGSNPVISQEQGLI